MFNISLSVRFNTKDAPGVIGKIGGCFGERGVSIQSIVQLNASSAGAEIIVITHEVREQQMNDALRAILHKPPYKTCKKRLVLNCRMSLESKKSFKSMCNSKHIPRTIFLSSRIFKMIWLRVMWVNVCGGKIWMLVLQNLF